MTTMICSLIHIRIPSGFATHFHTLGYACNAHLLVHAVPRFNSDNHIFNHSVTYGSGSTRLFSTFMDYTDEEMETWLEY